MLWAKQRVWGTYFTLIRLPWLCIKVLRFKPGGKLSVQRHMHRNEWWLILRGQGWVYDPDFSRPDLGREMWEGSCSTGNHLMKRGVWHSYKAGEEEPVYALEIQWGRKVSESDIERWQG